MNRSIRLFVLLALLMFAGATSVVGDSLDLNDKTIATTISVDKKDGEIWLYVEIANVEASGGPGVSGSASGSASPYILVKAHGETFAQAQQNLDRQLDKPLYIGGVRLLLLTERFAQDDLVEYLFQLRADETYRKKVITATTQDGLDTIYDTINGQDQSVGYSAENTIQTLDDTGGCSVRTTSRLLENLSDTYTGILIPCIGLQGKSIAFTGYTVVNDTKAVGFIPVDACKGLNMLKAKEAKTYYTFAYRDTRYTVETILKKMKVAPSYRDGRAGFTFTLGFDATVEYGSKKTPYGLTKEDEDEIAEQVKQRIQQDLLLAFDQAQAVFRTDYLQCDDAFRVKYPALFDGLNWNDVFPQASMTANVDVNLLPAQRVDYSVDVAR